MGKDGFPVLDTAVARPLRVVDSPEIFPVIDDGNLRSVAGGDQAAKGLQSRSHLSDVAEHAGVAAAVMIHHSAVEFFKRAAALAPLEILHGIGSVRDGLHRAEHMYAGPFQFADGLPVGGGRRAFHQQERLLFERAHQIMVEREPAGNLRFGFLVFTPGGIRVPGDDVHRILEGVVVQLVEEIHEIGGDRQIRADSLDGFSLPADEIVCLMGAEPVPVKVKPVHRFLAGRNGRFDLVPGRIAMAPEIGPPRLVEGVERAVFFTQPAAESLLAQRTVALPAILVGQVPQDDAGMMGEAFCESGVDLPHLFAVDRRGIAVVVALAVQIARHIAADAADLRIFAGHPRGLCAAWRGENGRDPVLIKVGDDGLEPVKIVAALLRFQPGPRKNPDRDAVDVRFFHQVDVRGKDVRSVEPLIRIIVPAVQQA